MAFSFVKDIGTFAWSDISGPPNPFTITIPAGGVAAGNMLLVFGANGGSPVTTVTDTQLNAYTIRANVIGGISLIDSRIATPLVSGNTISIARTSNPWATFAVAEFSGGWFEGATSGSWSGSSAATGGAQTHSSPNGLALGLFQLISASLSITTPGSGFTNMTGALRVIGEGGTSSIDWEYKIGSLASPITATATLSGTCNGTGFTAIYTETEPQTPHLGRIITSGMRLA